MLSFRKTLAATLALGSIVVGVAPARALTTDPVAITNPNALLPIIPGSANINSLGFNQTNFASVWSAAPSGTTPVLTDVRLWAKGTLSGSFVVKNTNTGAPINVASPALNFNLRANGMNTSSLTTSNQTGSVAAASLGQTGTTAQPFPGTPPPANNTPGAGYCPAGNWVAGAIINVGFDVQLWSCTTATETTFAINPPPPATTSTNWSLIGGGNTNGIASSFWTGNTVSIPSLVTLSFTSFTPESSTASFQLNGSGTDNYLVYDYIYAPNQVPAPLPLAGAGLAFGFSRRLRRRIKSSATTAS